MSTSTSSTISSESRMSTALLKLSKKLRREVGMAINDFNMIEDGDKIMVCLSGGKDSYALLDILISLQKYAPVNFELLAVNLDQQQPGFPKEVLPNYLESLGIPYRIVNEDTYSVVKRIIAEGKTTCSLCSRMRRGILYRVAQEEQCTKIALGHHRDDMVETLFLNMFFAGKMKSMPPKLVSDNNIHTVIRPLAYCREKDLEKYAQLKQFPIIPCNLCGSQPNLQRGIVKQMLQTWDKQYPGRVETIFRSMQNLVLSHLPDRTHYDFVNISSLSQQAYNPHYQVGEVEKARINILAPKPEQIHFVQASTNTVAGNHDSTAKDTVCVSNLQNTNITATCSNMSTTAKLVTSKEFTEEELDALAAEELFEHPNYDAMAETIATQALAEELESHKIDGLHIKQL